MNPSGKKKTQEYEGNYFSIDEIIATEQRVPCRFDYQAYNLGFLEAGSDNEHILAGTKMELPFWLAWSLGKKNKNRPEFISTEVPKAYKEGYREILSADPSVVDLHKLGPHYYLFGMLMLQFRHTESPDIAASLLQTFQGRFRKIMDFSQNAFHEDLTQLTEKLDETERCIFQCGQLGLNDFMRWQKGETQKITTSDMVVNLRKRKRVAMDS